MTVIVDKQTQDETKYESKYRSFIKLISSEVF